MNNFNKDILFTIKKLINEDNLIQLQEYYRQILNLRTLYCS